MVSADCGPMIVNRLDCRPTDASSRALHVGVGGWLLETGSHEPAFADFAAHLMRQCRKRRGDGVVVLDVGANVGSMVLPWATEMREWGNVIAIEPQEFVFWALAGNIALHNLFNARAILAACGSENGELMIPYMDPRKPGLFGELSLRKPGADVGQAVDYSPEALVRMRLISLDGLNLPRCDLIKIDVEGMEDEVIAGAEQLIARERPLVLFERWKCDWDAVTAFFERHDYDVRVIGEIDALAIPRTGLLAGVLA